MKHFARLFCAPYATLAGCLPAFNSGGQGDKGPDPISDLPPGVKLESADVGLRALNAAQYRNTMRELLGVTDADLKDISVPSDGATPSLLTVTRLDDAAARLTELGAHRKWVGCDVSGEGNVLSAWSGHESSAFSAVGGLVRHGDRKEMPRQPPASTNGAPRRDHRDGACPCRGARGSAQNRLRHRDDENAPVSRAAPSRARRTRPPW